MTLTHEVCPASEQPPITYCVEERWQTKHYAASVIAAWAVGTFAILVGLFLWASQQPVNLDFSGGVFPSPSLQ